MWGAHDLPFEPVSFECGLSILGSSAAWPTAPPSAGPPTRAPTPVTRSADSPRDCFESIRRATGFASRPRPSPELAQPLLPQTSAPCASRRSDRVPVQAPNVCLRSRPRRTSLGGHREARTTWPIRQPAPNHQPSRRSTAPSYAPPHTDQPDSGLRSPGARHRPSVHMAVDRLRVSRNQVVGSVTLFLMNSSMSLIR